MADWIDETLIDPDTHLVFDGIKAGSLVRAQYTYCQGVVVGLETELSVRTNDDRHPARVRRLVSAISEHMAPGGVIMGAGGGDGGLFSGVTARYLGAGRDRPAGRLRRGCRRAGYRAHGRAGLGRGGVGQPPDRGRPAAVRRVLGPHRRGADRRR